MAPVHQPENYRDYLYFKRRFFDGAVIQKHEVSLVKGYRSLGAILFSRCKNIPSDSEYVMMLEAYPNCYGGASLARGIARTLWEHDRSDISPRDPINVHGRLRWVDVPYMCK